MRSFFSVRKLSRLLTECERVKDEGRFYELGSLLLRIVDLADNIESEAYDILDLRTTAYICAIQDWVLLGMPRAACECCGRAVSLKKTICFLDDEYGHDEHEEHEHCHEDGCCDDEDDCEERPGQYCDSELASLMVDYMELLRL